jgi:NDP-sugar pyrophosphorylase family protein
MITRTVVVLAGGLGTRLRSEVSEVPKPMAPIAGRPFLEILLNDLARQGIEEIVLSTGYLHRVIENHFKNEWKEMRIHYVVESEPLGTGGALVKAFGSVNESSAYVLNGDTLLKESLSALSNVFVQNDADLAMFVRKINDGGRYSACTLAGDRVVQFSEGETGVPACINAGTYLVRTAFINEIMHAPPFSFETKVLPSAAITKKIFARFSDAPFIDIGVPESFHFAQTFIPELEI